MNNYYERKWDIIEEIDIDLFDGNLVRIQWVERESQEEVAPAQIRIHTTAHTKASEQDFIFVTTQTLTRPQLEELSKLRSGAPHATGWELGL
jgi:hypothetical protein